MNKETLEYHNLKMKWYKALREKTYNEVEKILEEARIYLEENIDKIDFISSSKDYEDWVDKTI